MTLKTNISAGALDQIFRQARTYTKWLPEPVPVELLEQIYGLACLGPTSANTVPGRFVFVITPEAKARLLPAMAEGNVEKTRTAPVTVVIGFDTLFYEKLPRLSPGMDPTMFASNKALAEETAFRNGSLEGAYFILAARAMGLDCGPMSGFDAAKVNAEFFPDGKWKANFICNLGYGDASNLHPRKPRLEFEESCLVL